MCPCFSSHRSLTFMEGQALRQMRLCHLKSCALLHSHVKRVLLWVCHSLLCSLVRLWTFRFTQSWTYWTRCKFSLCCSPECIHHASIARLLYYGQMHMTSHMRKRHVYACINVLAIHDGSDIPVLPWKSPYLHGSYATRPGWQKNNTQSSYILTDKNAYTLAHTLARYITFPQSAACAWVGDCVYQDFDLLPTTLTFISLPMWFSLSLSVSLI